MVRHQGRRYADSRTPNARYAIVVHDRRCVRRRQRPDHGPGRSVKARGDDQAARRSLVMQTADVGDWDDRAAGWQLSHPRDGRILVQREVSAPLVIVGEVALQVTVPRALVPHDDVIEALALK